MQGQNDGQDATGIKQGITPSSVCTPLLTPRPSRPLLCYGGRQPLPARHAKSRELVMPEVRCLPCLGAVTLQENFRLREFAFCWQMLKAASHNCINDRYQAMLARKNKMHWKS
eukprot:1161210-Pelagomonas_calceolata.AAC.5